MKTNYRNASLWFFGSFGSRARSHMAAAIQREGAAGLILSHAHIDPDRGLDDDDPFAGLGIQNISPTPNQINDVWHLPGGRAQKLERLFNIVADNYRQDRRKQKLDTTPSPIIIFTNAAIAVNLQRMIDAVKGSMDQTAILVVTELNKHIAQNMSQQARRNAFERERRGFESLQALYEQDEEMGIEAVLLISDPSPFASQYSADTQWRFLSEPLISLLRGKVDDKSNLSCFEILKYLHRHSPVVSIAMASVSVDIETPFRLVRLFRRGWPGDTPRGNERGRVNVHDAVNKMNRLIGTMLTQETTRAFDMPVRTDNVEAAIVSIPIPPSDARRWGKFTGYVSVHRPASLPYAKSIVARGSGARYPVSSNEPLVMQVSLIYSLVALPYDLLTPVEAPHELTAPQQNGHAQPAPDGLAEIELEQSPAYTTSNTAPLIPEQAPANLVSEQVNGKATSEKTETLGQPRKTQKIEQSSAEPGALAAPDLADSSED